MSDIPPPPPPTSSPQPAYGGTTPPPVGPDYASWLSRVGANLLDGLVNIAVAIPLLVPGFVLLFGSMDV